MHGIQLFDDNDDGTVFRDVIMLALLGFVTIVVLLLPHLNPPTRVAEDTEPPGNVIVEVRWPDDFNSDVDLWVEAPGDVPVGYSNQGGRIFNLLRDDLGIDGDATGLNYEVAFSRGAPAGEYTVNVHLYRNVDAPLPIPVTMVVRLKTDAVSKPVTIATREVMIDRLGQELTIVRFSLDASGQLLPSSIHQLQRDLRAGRR